MGSSIHPINLRYPHLYQTQITTSSYFLNSPHSQVSSCHLEFSHYHQLASSSFSLILNNDWSNAFSLLQSHQDDSIVMAACKVYISMLKFFMSPSNVGALNLMNEGHKVMERCRRANQDFELSTDPELKASITCNMLLNDIIWSQCSVCMSIIAIFHNNDLVTSAFNIKKAIAFHKKIYLELLNHVSSSKNYACKNREEDNYIDENNNENNCIKNNENDKLSSNNEENKSKKRGLVNFFGGFLEPLSKGVFSRSGLNIPKQINKYFADSEDDNDDEDSFDEEDDEEDDEGEKLDNIFNFVDMSVWKKICDGCDVFKNLVEEKKDEKDSFFGGIFEKKSSEQINGYKTGDLTFNRIYLSKLVGLVSMGLGLPLLLLLFLPRHTIITTAANFLGVNNNKNFFDSHRSFEAFELLTISSLSSSFISPVANCLLLYFLCIYRNHCALSENHFATIQNSRMIEHLLVDFERINGDCIFKYYFKGKLAVIKGKVKEAQRVLKAGISEVNVDAQLKALCEYDLSRVYIMKFDWNKSSKLLERLLDNLISPHPHYLYLLIISQGAKGKWNEKNLKTLASLLRNKKLGKHFFTDRVISAAKNDTKWSTNLCKVFCYEAIYLWGSFKALKIQQLDTVVAVCQTQLEGVYSALACLLTGVCVTTLVEKRVQQTFLLSEKLFGIDSWFLQALQHHSELPSSEHHILCMSCYELATLKARLKDFEKAKLWYKKAKSFDGKDIIFKWNMGEEIVKELDDEKNEKLKDEGKSSEVKKEKINENNRCDIKNITKEKQEIKTEQQKEPIVEKIDEKAIKTNEENPSTKAQKSASKEDSSCSIQ